MKRKYMILNSKQQASLYNARRRNSKIRFGSPPIALATFNPPDSTRVPGYSYNVSALFTGGAISSYTLIGTLPLGLNLNPTTGLIDGTPTTVQTETNISITGNNTDGSSITNKADIVIT